MWSISLHTIAFGGSFNQPLAGVEWPVSLQGLSCCHDFNQPITGTVAGFPSTAIVRVWLQPARHWTCVATFPATAAAQSNQPVIGVVWSGSCISCRLESSSTSPSLEWCGRAHCSSYRSEGALTSTHRRGFVAGLAARAEVRVLLQPTHRRRVVAGLSATASLEVGFFFQPANYWSYVAGIFTKCSSFEGKYSRTDLKACFRTLGFCSG